MKSRALLLPIAALLLLAAPPLLAQEEDEEGRYALGIAGGMVDTGANAEPYLTASLRIKAGKSDEADESQGGITGYFEPEVGYWTIDDKVDGIPIEATDLLVGVNIGGAVRLRMVEYFLGAGIGYHFMDIDITRPNQTLSADDEVLGLNAQFGIDIRMNDTLSLFGVGRFDIIDVDEDSLISDRQSKAYLGLRFRF